LKNDIEDITPHLRSIGIQRNDTIVSIPDQSHLSLYLMNQKGWTEYAERFYNQGAVVYLNRNEKGIETSIQKGARYLIVNGLDELYQRPFLHKYAVHLAGTFREIFIFDLTKRASRNFVLPNRQVKEIIVCDTESLDANGEEFKGLHGDYSFSGAKMRSKEYAYSGSYSAKLTSEDPFSMGMKIPEVAHGESFILSVMKKKNAGSFDLVASGEGKPGFYYTEIETLESNNPAWEILKMEFHVPKHMDGRTLSIYCWNHGSEPAYADDLKVVQFHSYFK